MMKVQGLTCVVLAGLVTIALGCGGGANHQQESGMAEASSLEPGQSGQSNVRASSSVAAKGTGQGLSENGSSGGLASTPSDSSLESSPEFELGNALEPFDPPSLEELEATANWIDGPVLEGMALVRDEQRRAGPPELDWSAAAALRNDSAEANRKILDSLGRLAPEDGSGVDFDATFVRHVTGDLGSTNPLLAQTVTEAEYGSLTGTGLLTFDRHFNYMGDADTVVSWQTSEDRLVDKVVLRGDLTWSDGQPITAHDVAFTHKLIMTDHPELVIPAVRQGPDELKAVVAYDDRTVVFFHKAALVTNKRNILFPIVPRHIYADTVAEDPSLSRSDRHRELEDNPVVGGSYVLTKRARNQEFVVRRRESAYMYQGKQVRRRPYFAELRVKMIEDVNTALLALKKGDIEEMILRPEQWSSQTSGSDFYERNTKVTALEWTNFNFVWNIESVYFSDKRVRWAMSYAFDYDELLQTICRGLYQQGRGTYHPTSRMFPDDGPAPIQQDLDRAEDLLDEAGWGDSDGDGIRDKRINGKPVRFEFALMTYQTDTGRQCATLMKECLEQIGILCYVKPTEFTVMTQKLMDREFDGSMNGWGTGVDPDTSANLWMTGEPRNYANYSNPRLDALFLAARREFDEEKRNAMYGEIHNLLWDDQPYTWLFYRNAFYAFNKKLRGYNFSPRGPYDYSPGISSIYVPAVLP